MGVYYEMQCNKILLLIRFYLLPILRLIPTNISYAYWFAVKLGGLFYDCCT